MQIQHLLLCTLCLLPFSGPSSGEELNLVFEKSKISITKLSNVSDTDPNLKIALYSSEFFKPQRTSNYVYSKTVELIALDCPATKAIQLHFSWFDADGNMVNSVNFPDDLKQGNWITPGKNSILKRQVDFACSH